MLIYLATLKRLGKKITGSGLWGGGGGGGPVGSLIRKKKL